VPAPARLLAANRATAAISPRAAVEAAAGGAKRLAAAERLIRRATMGWTLAEQRELDELGYDAWLERQLAYEAIDDTEVEAVLAGALPTLAMTPAEILARYEGDPESPIFELIIATLLRGIYSPRQLFERMVLFWTDHFNIHLFADTGYLLKPTDDREVIRRYALGSFPELLSASAHSPAMLSFLTNDSNFAGHPNENYAREVMELHTLGAAGFSEHDVKEVARCFTGWTFAGTPAGPDFGRFRFDQSAHDPGPKSVLGHSIVDSVGASDGLRVIEILAGSGDTARSIATKLLRWFWGYEPRSHHVQQVAGTYLESGGDLRKMVRKILKKNKMKSAKPKLKRPLHLQTSALRALFAEVGHPGYLVEQLLRAGHLPFDWAPPNGYPDSEGYWSGFILPRWNFAATFLWKKAGAAIRFELPFVDASLPLPEVVAGIDTFLFNGGMTEATRRTLLEFLATGKLSQNLIHDAIGLAVAAPEFQEY
jgi:uncharacterized protein (DUF1800 family)